jgi:hypothetical protein
VTLTHGLRGLLLLCAQIAVYYAWLGYYGYMLMIPAVLGSVMVWLMDYRGWDYPEGEVRASTQDPTPI